MTTTVDIRPLNAVGVSSNYRICSEPKSGEIVERVDLGDGLTAVIFVREDGFPEWRILEPENPVPIDRVEIERAEGLAHECIKVTLRAETRKGNGKPDSVFCDDWTVSALNNASSTLLAWGHSAPKPGGGYDKCDFTVFWQDGESYSGRFDLQHGGTDGGQNFRDSLMHRILFYSGLGRTPAHFFRKNAVEMYSEAEGRVRYLDMVKAHPDFVQFCRQTLATREL